MERFKDRRSVRKYKRQEVPEEMIAALAEEASRAATMGNMQLYSLVVTTDADVQEREALSEAHHHQPMVEEAPAVLTFCADFHRFSRWCEERKAEPGYGNFVSFINAATDTLLFAQAFITLAEERGLGTCIPLSGAGADRNSRMAGREPGADRPPARGGNPAQRSLSRIYF